MTTAVIEGAVHAISAVPALGLVAAMSLASPPGPVRSALSHAAVFTAAAALSRAMPDGPHAQALAALALTLVGLRVAWPRPVSRIAFGALLVVCGFAAGSAAGLPTATGGEAFGSLAVLFSIALGLLAVRRAMRFPDRLAFAAGVARQMAGAWLGAGGLLLLALWLRTADF